MASVFFITSSILAAVYAHFHFGHFACTYADVWRSEYVCPKCGHFNPSFRALREARQKGTNAGRLSVSPQRDPSAANANGVSPPGVSSLGSDRTERSRSRSREDEKANIVSGEQDAMEASSAGMDVDS